MLNRFRALNSLPILFLASILILGALCQIPAPRPKMQVYISNTAQYYYGKTCQTTFTVVSDYFNRPNPSQYQFFAVGMTDKNSWIPMSQKLNPIALVHLSNAGPNRVLAVENCLSNLTTTDGFCIAAPRSTNPFLDSRIKYNSTHYMHRFTLTHSICPMKANDINTHHIKYTIQMTDTISPIASNIVAKINKYFTWTGLKYSFTQRVLINPIINSDQSYFYYENNHNIPAQNKKLYVGEKQILSFVFDIKNVTQQEYWQYFRVAFSNTSQIQFGNCKKTVSSAMKNSRLYTNPKYYPVLCESTNGLLGFTNLNYVYDSYKYNSALNVYGLYKYPGVRVNLSVEVTFKTPFSFLLGCQIITKTTKKIDGNGYLVELGSQTPFILYDSINNLQTITVVEKPVPAPTPVPTPTPAPAPTPTPPSQKPIKIQDSILSVTGISILGFIIISILGSIWIVYDFKRPSYNQNLKFPFFLFIIADPLIKLIFYAYITNQEDPNDPLNKSQSNKVFGVIIAFQYLLLNLIWFFCYLYNTKNSSTDQEDLTKTQQQVKSTSKVMLIASIIYSYKLYCLTFLGIHKSKNSDKPNFTFNQLKAFNKIFRVLLGIQITIVCILVLIFGQVCLNSYVISGYCFYQSIFMLMLVVLLRFIYLHNNVDNQLQYTQYDKTMHTTSYAASQAGGQSTGRALRHTDRSERSERRGSRDKENKDFSRSNRCKSKTNANGDGQGSIHDRRRDSMCSRKNDQNKSNVSGRRTQKSGNGQMKSAKYSKSKGKQNSEKYMKSNINNTVGQYPDFDFSINPKATYKDSQNKDQYFDKSMKGDRSQSGNKSKGRTKSQIQGESRSNKSRKEEEDVCRTNAPQTDIQYAQSHRQSGKQFEAVYQQNKQKQRSYKNSKRKSEYQGQKSGKYEGDHKFEAENALDQGDYTSQYEKNQSGAYRHDNKGNVSVKQYTVARQEQEDQTIFQARQRSILQRQTIRDDVASMAQRSLASQNSMLSRR